MKVSIFLGLLGLTLVLAASRSKRDAYDLPSGAELLVGDVRTTFVCSNDGYYADEDNFCQIFHVCHTVVNPDGTSEMMQWSFFCGNQTVFNQFSLTCSSPEDTVPCGSARDFWYLNDNIGAGPNVKFHNDQDVARAVDVTPGRAAHTLRPQDIHAHNRVPFFVQTPSRASIPPPPLAREDPKRPPPPARQAPNRPPPPKAFQG